MTRPKHLTLQFIIAIITFLIIIFFGSNLISNLQWNGMALSFKWLSEPSGFALAEHVLPYKPSDSYLWALFIGWLNSLRVILIGLLNLLKKILIRGFF